MICPVCNQNIPEGSNYCPSCAADLTKYRRQMLAGRQQPPRRPQQQDPRMMPPQNPMMPQQNPMMPTQQDPRMQQQYTGRYPSYPPQYGDGGGEGGLLEGITPRGKLFFGVGGLVLVGVLVLLVARLFGGGGGGANEYTAPPPVESPTFAPYGGNEYDPFNTPEPDEDENGFGNLYVPPTPPPATPEPTFTVLKRNHSGPEVTRLQERLKLLGYLPADEPVDGIYGTATVNAVKEFQKKTDGLTVDGDAGPETQRRLFSIAIPDEEPPVIVPQQEEGPVNQPG